MSVEKLISGVSGGVSPRDGSINFFVLADGVKADDMKGPGSFVGTSLVITAGLVRGSDGAVLGVQSGFQTNISYGSALTSSTVIPISETSAEIIAALIMTLRLKP